MKIQVTVVIPAYNGVKFIRNAIDSALAQTVPNIEVLIVDDGSTDSTVEMVEAIKDSRVRVVRQRNGGVASARNFGLREARGDIIALLDQDDSWFVDKLECQLPMLEAPNVGAVGALMTYVGDKGPIRATSGEIADNQRERIAAAGLMPFAPSSLIARRSTLLSIGGFDEKLVQEVGPIDDLDLLARIAVGHEILTYPRSLGYYRVHADAGTFARFFEMQKGTRFLQARVSSVARGDNPLTWDEWTEITPNDLGVRRRERARFLYRQGGLRVASGNPVRGGATLLMAAALSPSYVLRRLWRQSRT